MTYGKMFNEITSKLKKKQTLSVDDYRPATPMYLEDVDISRGIILWMRDGSKIIYLPSKEV